MAPTWQPCKRNASQTRASTRADRHSKNTVLPLSYGSYGWSSLPVNVLDCQSSKSNPVDSNDDTESHPITRMAIVDSLNFEFEPKLQPVVLPPTRFMHPKMPDNQQYHTWNTWYACRHWALKLSPRTCHDFRTSKCINGVKCDTTGTCVSFSFHQTTRNDASSDNSIEHVQTTGNGPQTQLTSWQVGMSLLDVQTQGTRGNLEL